MIIYGSHDVLVKCNASTKSHGTTIIYNGGYCNCVICLGMQVPLNGIGWDGMGWDGMGWDGMGWDGMRWDGVGMGEKDGGSGGDKCKIYGKGNCCNGKYQRKIATF